MTRLARLEAELSRLLETRKFAEAKFVLGRVSDLRYQIEHERYLEKYGRTDRERT